MRSTLAGCFAGGGQGVVARPEQLARPERRQRCDSRSAASRRWGLLSLQVALMAGGDVSGGAEYPQS